MPNGKPMLNEEFKVWLDDMELEFKPRPLLERKPEHPFLKGLGWGLLISAVIVGATFLIMRAC